MSKYYEKTEKQLEEERLLEEFLANNFAYVPDASYDEAIDYDELITAWDGGQTEYRRLPIYSDNEGEAESQLSFTVTKSGYKGDETEIRSVLEVSGSPDAIQDLGDNKVLDVAIIDTVNKELNKDEEIFWDADKFDWDRKGLTEVRSWKGVTIKLNDLSIAGDEFYHTAPFAGCSNLRTMDEKTAPKLEGDSLDSAFAGCTKFNSSLAHWDFSGIVDAKGMFNGCYNLSEANLVATLRKMRADRNAVVTPDNPMYIGVGGVKVHKPSTLQLIRDMYLEGQIVVGIDDHINDFASLTASLDESDEVTVTYYATSKNLSSRTTITNDFNDDIAQNAKVGEKFTLQIPLDFEGIINFYGEDQFGLKSTYALKVVRTPIGLEAQVQFADWENNQIFVPILVTNTSKEETLKVTSDGWYVERTGSQSANLKPKESELFLPQSPYTVEGEQSVTFVGLVERTGRVTEVEALFNIGPNPGEVIFTDPNGKQYYELDAHIIKANNSGNYMMLPTATDVVWLEVDGVPARVKNVDEVIQLEPENIPAGVNFVSRITARVKGTSAGIAQGQTIRAIFDWDNSDSLTLLDWMEDIQQIGLNSKTGQRRQVVDGTNAFFNYGGANIPTLDISNLRSMERMFFSARNFVGATIEDWDTSGITNMNQMFDGATNFNADITGWNVSRVSRMTKMFNNAVSFTQDLTTWNVNLIERKPQDFDENSWIGTSQVADGCCRGGDNPEWGRPVWKSDGTACRKNCTEQDTDFHILVANNSGKNIVLPAADGVKFLEIDGIPVEISRIARGETVAQAAGQTIRAIFDWDNDFDNSTKNTRLEWVGEFVQFGKNSWTGSPNQVAEGRYAFAGITTEKIARLVTSNLDDMRGMFYNAEKFNDPQVRSWDVSNSVSIEDMFRNAVSFNQDLSRWDTKNVVDAEYAFGNAKAFNQDLSGWDVRNLIANKAQSFGTFAGTGGQDGCCRPAGMADWGHPKWGTAGGECDGNCEGMPIFITDTHEYYAEDLHIFDVRDNLNDIFLPISTADGKSSLIYLDFDGVRVDHTLVEVEDARVDTFPGTSRTALYNIKVEGRRPKVISAIFDWDNSQGWDLGWIKNVQQFGYNHQTRVQNQIAAPLAAFNRMGTPGTPFKSEALDNLDLSNLRSYEGLFANTVIDTNLELSTGSVTNMDYTFYGADVRMDVTEWDTGEVTSMDRMFFKAKFNQEIGDWDVNKVRNMDKMFASAVGFNQDLTLWNVKDLAEPTDFDIHNGAPLASWVGDTDADECGNPAGDENWGRPNWENIPCRPAKREDFEDKDFHKVRLINDGSSKTVYLPAFRERADGLFYVDIDGENAVDQFVYQNGAYESINPIEMKGQEIYAILDWGNNGKSMDFIEDITQFGYNSVVDEYNAVSSFSKLLQGFAGTRCSGLNPKTTVYNANSGQDYTYLLKDSNIETLGSFEPFNIVHVWGMLEGATNFKDSVVGWDVSRVSEFNRMFANIPNFNQPIGTWNATPNKMTSMFEGCTNFNQNLNGWDWSRLSKDQADDCFKGTSYNQDMSGIVFTGGSQQTWNMNDVPSWTGNGLGPDICGVAEGDTDGEGREWGRPHYYSTEVTCKGEYNFGEIDTMGSDEYSMSGKKIAVGADALV
ncbi:MAG: BspA family leucine-rich repeat surface protein [Euryarchaeota archaeon]